MDYLISLFIDDEMNLDEKIDFVEVIHEDAAFKDQSVEMLQMEKLLRSDVTGFAPSVAEPEKKVGFINFRRFLGLGFASAMAVILIFFAYPYINIKPSIDKKPADNPNTLMIRRFVIYQPEAEEIDITGSFTKWESVPKKRIGSSGYWEIQLKLPEGEHRFTYIVNGDRRIPDPTVLSREHDDFGGNNSILNVKARA